MDIISASEQQKLVELIKAQELRTHAELVTVVAEAADSYRIYPTCYALGVATAVGLLFGGSISLAWLSLLEVIALVLSYYIFSTPAVKFHLIPDIVKKNRARAFAKQCFLDLHVNRTDHDSGVMFFVSHFERYVEVIADKGLDKAVDNGKWQAAVNQFSQTIKTGELHKAYEIGITSIGKILAEHAPVRAEKNPDELPNHLVVVSHPYN